MIIKNSRCDLTKNFILLLLNTLSFAHKCNFVYLKFVKVILDFALAFVASIILFPVFFIVAVALAVVNKGNPFFLQTRPGKNEQLFKIVKFKTMTNEKDEKGNLLPDADRLTTVGKLVRKTSLDEIPQLINVLKGDMSLVGPRPLLPEYLEIFNNFQKRRHAVRPGITGWAAVNGRNAISWQRKFELDVYYVENVSFWLDIKIIWLTILKVLKSEGINAANSATTEAFNGRN